MHIWFYNHEPLSFPFLLKILRIEKLHCSCSRKRQRELQFFQEKENYSFLVAPLSLLCSHFDIINRSEAYLCTADRKGESDFFEEFRIRIAESSIHLSDC